jgi:sec-independent protein translocase protein TatA
LRGPSTCHKFDGMGFGFTELLIILAIVLIIFGPGKLPGLGSGVGNALRNFRKAVNRPDAIDVTPPEERKSGDGRTDRDS